MPRRTLPSMAILAGLLALGSKFAGKVLSTALGWASTLLFGRVPSDRQILVLAITFGSVIWMALLVGVLIPDVGTFLLLLLPSQDVVPDEVIRLIMLAGALIVPGVVGGLTLALQPAAERTPRGIAEAVARGYPLTALLAVLLLFLAGLAIWRKGSSLARGWTDAHVPIVVAGGAYDQVAKDLDSAVTASGLEVTPRAAPATMSAPARWLTKVAGRSSAALVPDRMIQLHGPDIDILIYPMDLLISGTPSNVARARAAMASRLTTTAAHMTTSAEAQALEDRLAALVRPPADEPDRRPRFDDIAKAELEAIDERLATLEIPYDEWEVLYRQRLQVERDLRTGAMADETVVGADGPDGGPAATAAAAVATLGRWLRSGAGAVIEAAADEKTGEMLDKLAGPDWRVAVRAAALASGAARDAMREVREDADAPSGAGEPLASPAGSPLDHDRDHDDDGDRDGKTATSEPVPSSPGR
jgi:hypothetical protein